MHNQARIRAARCAPSLEQEGFRMDGWSACGQRSGTRSVLRDHTKSRATKPSRGPMAVIQRGPRKNSGVFVIKRSYTRLSFS